MAITQGTTISSSVERVVDGDTVVVPVEGRAERLRLLCLDTEESHAGSDKPVTPWGREAAKEAARLLPAGTPVTLEFPGTETVKECLIRHRENFGRLLVFLHFEEGDFQEHMIQAGYSPYFSKYGHAPFHDHRDRYIGAERNAQSDPRGVWDQLTVNGAESRNYALLGLWWELRAEVIDDYRKRRQADPTLLDSRLDYAQLQALAVEGVETTVFTELATYRRIGQSHAIVDIGSRHQPFKLFVPDIETNGGQALLTLLSQRYVAGDAEHVRRSYAYVRGRLKIHRDEPEMVVENPDQVMDTPAPSRVIRLPDQEVVTPPARQ